MIVHYASRRARAADALWQARGSRSAAVTRLALLPAELLFRVGSALHHLRYDASLAHRRQSAVPVISVGNLTVGGTGKTPFVGWLTDELGAVGWRPGVLHGGYGSDEPELLRAWRPDMPVIVRRDRAAGAVEAVALGADVVILDDGFQHRRLARELDIVLVAAEQWTRRPRLLPRGPWREPPTALRRATLVVVTRKSATADAAAAVAREAGAFTRAPVVVARLAPAGWRAGGSRAGSHAGAQPPAGEAVLVTAVADWRPVATQASTAGARLDEALIFADHHPFDAADAEQIRRFAGARPVVCTEKDWVKLRTLLPARALAVLTLSVAFDSGLERVRAALSGLRTGG
jgi:tetraacyldisaccharide 4'-kinase